LSVDIETIVVGGGVVGLACASALAERGQDVLLIERHDRLGSETSSRNSEVVHAGLYYPPGSLKARLCVAGRQRLVGFCREAGVAIAPLGKLVVATDVSEIEGLERIAATARTNGVHDVALLSAAEARQLEPALACTAALLSPSTAVIDSHAYILAVEARLRDHNGVVALATHVVDITHEGGGFRLQTVSEGCATSITCRHLVLSAGLEASRAGRLLAPSLSCPVPETRYAKGHYFALQGRAPFQRLIYPLPGNGGLGIHYTLSTAGEAKFGPDVQWCETPSLEFEDPDGKRRAAFATAIRRYWPDVREESLIPGYTGIRPKISGRGEPAADFAIHGPAEHGLDGLVALYGIESPGLTSSLAIGDLVAAMLRPSASPQGDSARSIECTSEH
jgi:L-2-hydroxyglutarate oxidase LhgO